MEVVKGVPVEVVNCGKKSFCDDDDDDDDNN